MEAALAFDDDASLLATLSILVERDNITATEIAGCAMPRLIAGLKKHPVKRVAALAKAVVATWKQIVAEAEEEDEEEVLEETKRKSEDTT